MKIAKNLYNTKIQSSLLACMFVHFCTLLQWLIMKNSGILLISENKGRKYKIRDKQL